MPLLQEEGPLVLSGGEGELGVLTYLVARCFLSRADRIQQFVIPSVQASMTHGLDESRTYGWLIASYVGLQSKYACLVAPSGAVNRGFGVNFYHLYTSRNHPPYRSSMSQHLATKREEGHEQPVTYTPVSP